MIGIVHFPNLATAFKTSVRLINYLTELTTVHFI